MPCTQSWIEVILPWPHDERALARFWCQCLSGVFSASRLASFRRISWESLRANEHFRTKGRNVISSSVARAAIPEEQCTARATTKDHRQTWEIKFDVAEEVCWWFVKHKSYSYNVCNFSWREAKAKLKLTSTYDHCTMPSEGQASQSNFSQQVSLLRNIPFSALRMTKDPIGKVNASAGLCHLILKYVLRPFA